MMLYAIAGLGVLFGIGLWTIGKRAEYRLKYADRLAVASEDFFDAATVLVESGRAPDGLVDFVIAIGNQLNERFIAFKLLWFLSTMRARNAVQSPDERVRRLQNAVEALDAPLREQWRKLAVSWTLVVIYRSPLAGYVLGALALFRVRKTGAKEFNGDDDANDLMIGWGSGLPA